MLFHAVSKFSNSSSKKGEAGDPRMQLSIRDQHCPPGRRGLGMDRDEVTLVIRNNEAEKNGVQTSTNIYKHLQSRSNRKNCPLKKPGCTMRDRTLEPSSEPSKPSLQFCQPLSKSHEMSCSYDFICHASAMCHYSFQIR